MNGLDATPESDTENANLASIIQSIINKGGNYKLDTSIKSFTDPDLATKLAASGFFFMTDMESIDDPTSPAFLPADAIGRPRKLGEQRRCDHDDRYGRRRRHQLPEFRFWLGFDHHRAVTAGRSILPMRQEHPLRVVRPL